MTKLLRSLVGIIAGVAFSGGVAVMCAVILGIARSGDRVLIAKLGPGMTFDWSGLLSGAAQITGAGGFIACGVVVAWVFAREFADGTITGLFATPISRRVIAVAKIAAVMIWAIAAAGLLVLLLLVAGLAFGFGMPQPSEWAGLGRQFALAVLTAVVVLPVAWVASLTRSLLAAIGSAIGLLILAQIGVLAGAGAWLPFAAPALWAMTGGEGVSVVQLGLAALVGLVGVAATTIVWHRLQLDR
ncbi:ABC transporter permease [Microbacterium sulfonylureivorans]|uniref:ABC transporter permease n=1 Tax=Microbacterium sulfonylureivorans TaxID=2486854 RepID=UPI0013E096D0|nr:ABC transporter permease [Microbacterium sulfonylureivorans]